MAWSYTGAVRRHYSRAADFAWMSNEDLGWIATLVTATNDMEELSVAYVASIDLFEETQIFEALETIGAHQIPSNISLDDGQIALAINVYYSMLDKALTATFQGAGNDADDEALKALLGGPNFVGQNSYSKAGTGTDEPGFGGFLDQHISDHWTPPQNMRARTPIFMKISNQSAAIAATTGIDTEASHANFEQIAQRYWWRSSRLRRSERMAVSDVIKYQLIDT